MVCLSSKMPMLHLEGPDFSLSPADFREKRDPHARRGGGAPVSSLMFRFN